jgi:ACS family glucarate transporter-like MFS transporter
VPEAAPTRARYGVLAFLCSLSFVLYLDRVCIGQAAPAIQKELDLSNTEMGYALSAFVLAYGLFEVPTGRWGDRFGSRGVLARIVIWWSAFTALTGAAANLAMLVAVRFLFGAGEAGAYPNAARVLARWFPRSQRGAAQGLMLTSAQIGATISPRVAQWLIDDVGWRWTFVVFSAIGIVWAVAFYRWFRDDPARHPGVNEAERQLIAAGAPVDAHAEHHAPIPWGAIGRSPNVWLLGVVQTCSAAASYMYMMWYPSYLQQARGVSADDASWMSSLVLLGGALGVLASGFVNDWLGRVTAYHPARFRVYGFLGTAGSAVALAASVECESAWTTSAWAATAFALAISQQATFWNVTTEISGRNLGSIFGLMNSLGVPGAFVSTMFLGRFADWMAAQGYVGRAQWDPAFYIYAAVLLVGACCWLAVDARKKIPEGSD